MLQTAMCENLTTNIATKNSGNWSIVFRSKQVFSSLLSFNSSYGHGHSYSLPRAFRWSGQLNDSLVL